MNNEMTLAHSKKPSDSLCFEHMGILFLDIFFLSDLNVVAKLECLVTEAMMN